MTISLATKGVISGFIVQEVTVIVRSPIKGAQVIDPGTKGARVVEDAAKGAISKECP